MKKIKKMNQEKLGKIKNLCKVLGGTTEHPTFSQTGDGGDSEMEMDN